jgi:hypothetical protein
MKFLIFFIFIYAITTQDDEKKINIKVVPARTNKLSLDDLDEIKFEILHDVHNHNLDESTVEGFGR